MKVYKLTDERGQTMNNTQWGDNVTHKAAGSGELCTAGWLHYYDDPLLAVLLNPIHAAFEKPKLWEAEATGEMKSDHGLKFGCTKLTTLRVIPLPKVTTTQRVAFGILCAKSVVNDKQWVAWANAWLAGKDRSAAAAKAAWAAAAEAEEAAWAAAEDAARAAAAAAAWAAAEEAAAAAAWAVAAAAELDLKSIAAEAMEIS